MSLRANAVAARAPSHHVGKTRPVMEDLTYEMRLTQVKETLCRELGSHIIVDVSKTSRACIYTLRKTAVITDAHRSALKHVDRHVEIVYDQGVAKVRIVPVGLYSTEPERNYAHALRWRRVAMLFILGSLSALSYLVPQRYSPCALSSSHLPGCTK